MGDSRVRKGTMGNVVDKGLGKGVFWFLLHRGGRKVEMGGCIWPSLSPTLNPLFISVYGLLSSTMGR
jgi:hypothetical protein